MASRIRFRRFYECDTESDRSLDFGQDSLLYCLDTQKYYRIYNSTYEEVLPDEVIFISPIPISKLSISGIPDGTKFLRDDGSWATPAGGGGGGGGHIIYDSLGIALTQQPGLKFSRLSVTNDALNSLTLVTRPSDTYIGLTAPANPVEGDEWTNSETWKTYKYYDSFWVELSGTGTSGGGGGGSSSQQTDYDSAITGARNGANTLFTLSTNFVSGTTKVFVNGIRYSLGALNDYIETGTNQITFTNPPDSGDILVVDYLKP